ncbi:tetratricopeptide repeat protein, partial [Akkermansia sp. NBRC 115031]
MNWTHIFICILVAFTLPVSMLSGTEPLPDFNVLKKQAEGGDMESQFQLGRCYAFGTGTEKDDKQASGWFYKAAKQGHAKAQYNLGVAYATSLGVEHNDTEARKWLLKSAQQ